MGQCGDYQGMSFDQKRDALISAFAMRALLFACIVVSHPAGAMGADPANICFAAAQFAANRTGVPVEVLQAISLVETGRSVSGGKALEPWPWTFNHAGKGHWFSTLQAAKAEAGLLIDQGSYNIDLGCFQLNLRWHSKAFSSLDAMLDPNENALYAAAFLQSLYEKSESWSEAAGAYHSATPTLAAKYRVKFDETLAAINAGPGRAVPNAPSRNHEPQMDPQNNFPLLVAGVNGHGGSLVPLQPYAQPLIGVPSW